MPRFRIPQCWKEISPRRRGAMVVLFAVMLVVIFAFAAFVADLGFLQLTKARLENAADAAALAAALELDPNADQAAVRAAARASARSTLSTNLGDDAQFFNVDKDLEFGRQTFDPRTGVAQYQWGDNATPHNVVRAHADRQVRPVNVNGVPKAVDERLPLFFAPVIGLQKATLKATSVATFQARDIMVVLDFSASMNDDSTFEAISTLGRTAVEDNLRQIWQELGSPTYGRLQFTPQYAVFSGQPATRRIPHIDVTYKGTSIDVASTLTIASVRLEFSTGVLQTISFGSGTTGTFKGTLLNSGKTITRAWIRSGSNGTLGELFQFSNIEIEKALGLQNVRYPYPAGSWSEYISYCTSPYWQPAQTGYQYKFGYMTWINYVLDMRPMKSDTPDLWKTTSYPAEALKSGVDVFTDFLKNNAAEDRVGLAVYSTVGGAMLEFPLTQDAELLKTTTRLRQPGHYDWFTNIGAGMKLAREQLQSNSRPRAYRLMVLMTDGLANKPVDVTTAKNFVRQEAQLAKDSNIKILTISLGFKADPTLMQEVADITGGLHFNVPGGSSVQDYTDGMRDVFLQIGASRPLRLISDPGN